MPEISLDLVLQTCLAADDTPLGVQLKHVLSVAADKAARIKSVKGIRLLHELAESRGENILLPFELDDIDLSVASIIIGQSLVSGSGKGIYRNQIELNHARIYSAWSVTQTGFAHVSENDCRYVTDWKNPLLNSGEHRWVFSLMPAFRPEYQAAVKEAAASRPHVRVSIEGHLRFIFQGCGDTGAKEINCRCWIINSDSSSQQKPLLITDCRLSETPAKELTVEFLRSETILQLSAASDQKQWLHVQGSDLEAVFPIPEILQEQAATPLWINQIRGNPDYLLSYHKATIDIPQVLALECVKKYWWFTVPDKSAMIAAILTNDGKENP